MWGALLLGALGLFGGSLLGRANIALPGGTQTITQPADNGLLGLGGDMSSLLLLGLVGMPMIQSFMGSKGDGGSGSGSDDNDVFIIFDEDDDDE
jgi:hypothetical protein